jgi:hypothetical protein
VRRLVAELGVDQVVVDLARAEHEAGDVLAAARQTVVVQHGLEVALGELGQRRRGGRQSQQALRGHDHQRAPLRDQRLATEQVEVLAGRRAVGDADVALGAQLQEALQAA